MHKLRTQDSHLHLQNAERNRKLCCPLGRGPLPAMIEGIAGASRGSWVQLNLMAISMSKDATLKQQPQNKALSLCGSDRLEDNIYERIAEKVCHWQANKNKGKGDGEGKGAGKGK